MKAELHFNHVTCYSRFPGAMALVTYWKSITCILLAVAERKLLTVFWEGNRRPSCCMASDRLSIFPKTPCLYSDCLGLGSISSLSFQVMVLITAASMHVSCNMDYHNITLYVHMSQYITGHAPKPRHAGTRPTQYNPEKPTRGRT